MILAWAGWRVRNIAIKNEDLVEAVGVELFHSL
jgi:hypothetical protein